MEYKIVAMEFNRGMPNKGEFVSLDGCSWMRLTIESEGQLMYTIINGTSCVEFMDNLEALHRKVRHETEKKLAALAKDDQTLHELGRIRQVLGAPEFNRIVGWK